MTSLEVAVHEHRSALLGLAYRLLGSVSEAEDAVQEAFLRLERHGTDGIDNVGGWLNRTTSRICLDRLTSAQARREVYVGPWLPEPLESSGDPGDPVELAESVSMAFLVVLESLSPAERVAFLLHDVFGYDHAELAAILDRSEAACRQLVSRARKQVEARRPRFEPDPSVRAEVAGRFLEACRTGDLQALLSTLAPDVVLRSDGGGKVSAARRPVEGAERVMRFFEGLARQAPSDVVLETRWYNGTPGLVVGVADGSLLVVFVLDVADGAVRSIEAIRNPDKLAHLGPVRSATGP
ncbi:RNA polymerase sigma factor SigJ [Egicoccus sp. AB-alg2]|uniref:RNA polymerase sigma factor SigJ n=1 Tax=Egicoccus sp. AB-alg2 TaxID=3242693 RepID=UPI00359CD339